MPLFQIGGVNVSAWIDNEGRSTRRDFDAQSVVMSVRATAVEAVVTCVEEQIQIVIAQHEGSRVGKGSRLRRLAIRQRLIVTESLFAQDPKQFFRRRGPRQPEARFLEDRGSQRKDVSVLVTGSHYHRHYLSAV